MNTKLNKERERELVSSIKSPKSKNIAMLGSLFSFLLTFVASLTGIEMRMFPLPTRTSSTPSTSMASSLATSSKPVQTVHSNVHNSFSPSFLSPLLFIVVAEATWLHVEDAMLDNVKVSYRARSRNEILFYLFIFLISPALGWSRKCSCRLVSFFLSLYFCSVFITYETTSSTYWCCFSFSKLLSAKTNFKRCNKI